MKLEDMTTKSILHMECSEFQALWKYGEVTIPNMDKYGPKYGARPVVASMIWRGSENYDEMPFGLI